MPQPETSQAVTVAEITAKARLFPDLGEAWRCRALALVFAQRNVKARVKQTLLGHGWLVIQPILLAGVLTVFLGNLLNVPSDGLPYAVFVFTGTALWTAFQRAVNEASISLANSGNLLSKVYFPRLLVPVSAVVTALFDFLFIYIAVIATVIAYGRFPGWPIVLSPLFVLLALVLALAIGLWVTVIDSIYRDARLIVPYLLQLGFYASPIMYGAAVVPHAWKVVYALNPFTGILQGFRWSMVAGAVPPSAFALGWAAGLTALLLVSGLMVFAKFERVVVDYI